MNPVVVAQGVHKNYHLGREVIPALRGVDLNVERGEFVAIMGASGSGKTTLMHLIGGLDLPDKGDIKLEGQSIPRLSDGERTRFRRRRLGVVFQSYNLLPSLTAMENVMLPLLVDGQSAAKVRKRAGELMDQIGLGHRTAHRPAALSGGEQQRVAIARALMNEPLLILADEPTGNLDPISSVSVLNLLRELSSQAGTTIVMVTHEPAAASVADRAHVLNDGRFTGTIESPGAPDAALVESRYAELAN